MFPASKSNATKPRAWGSAETFSLPHAHSCKSHPGISRLPAPEESRFASPHSRLPGCLSPCSTSRRQLGPAWAAGASWRRDVALPDIMGRLVPAPASVRAGFQQSGTCCRAPAGTISCVANINHPCCQHQGSAAGTAAGFRHRATCREIVVQLCLQLIGKQTKKTGDYPARQITYTEVPEPFTVLSHSSQ